MHNETEQEREARYAKLLESPIFRAAILNLRAHIAGELPDLIAKLEGKQPNNCEN
jgi:hypothetical protein